MAIITFDIDNDSISVLVEKTDIIREKDDGVILSQSAQKNLVGEVLANDEFKICIIRGERD